MQPVHWCPAVPGQEIIAEDFRNATDPTGNDRHPGSESLDHDIGQGFGAGRDHDHFGQSECFMRLHRHEKTDICTGLFDEAGSILPISNHDCGQFLAALTVRFRKGVDEDIGPFNTRISPIKRKSAASCNATIGSNSLSAKPL